MALHANNLLKDGSDANMSERAKILWEDTDQSLGIYQFRLLRKEYCEDFIKEILVIKDCFPTAGLGQGMFISHGQFVCLIV
jgi:hypothetical protein